MAETTTTARLGSRGASAPAAGGSAASKGLAVDLAGVAKTYRTRSGEVIQALAPVDASIAAGEFVSIVGPSGCGKSTLVMLISGLLPISRGAVRLDGVPVTRPHPGIGVVFQRDLLLKWRTILDNILLPAEIKRWPKAQYRDLAEQLLKQVGLAGFGAKYPDELSGGMRQRVAICRALVQNPGLLLMDEPFGALDALTREQMSLDLQRLWGRLRNTVIFVTHSIDEAVFLSDRVIVMSPRPGRIELDLKIDLPRPRTLAGRSTPEFAVYVSEIRRVFEARGVLADPSME
jgi:NitT/TauT family transport system ATP-binding protein